MARNEGDTTRTSATQDANPSRRRRKSLPGRSSSLRSASVPRHRPSDQSPPPVPPASPELISSLISSLSTISTPAQSHFDSLPHIASRIGGSQTVPSSPSVYQSEFTQLIGQQNTPDNGFGMDYGAYNPPAESADSPFLHPDDAAISPVVRMAPAPAPSSPRSPRSSRSPKLKSSFGRDASPLRPTSRGSYTSSRAPADDHALSGFGIITTEPASRASRTASIASSSSGGRRSLKNSLGFLRRSSRESNRERENDRGMRSSSYEDNFVPRSARSRTSLKSRQSMADLVEEGDVKAPVGTKNNASSPGSPAHQMLATSFSSPGGIGSGRVIPTRESSLRHSFNKPHHRSARSRESSQAKGRDLSHAANVAKASAKDATEQTTRRIQQVKEQQKRIKSEMKEAQESESPQSYTASRNRPTLPRSTTEPIPNRRSREERPPVPRKYDPTENDPFEESAPSPAVQTRRTRDKKRNSQDRLDGPVSPTPRSHKRNSSGAFPRPSITEERPSSADSIDLAVESYVASPRLTQKVPHPQSGRLIAFSEVGDPKGHVVFCCLGMGLTRYLMAFYDELARTLKLRLVTLDRPGVGESDPCMEGEGTPLSWPDDVAIVCNHLKITKFSILAHSAGAIYALATALRIPQHIRGRIHLLAPWIPPSQMTNLGTLKEPLPTNAVPYSQRILRALPTPILKVANSSFMSATSSSITTSLPKSPRRNKRKSFSRDAPAPNVSDLTSPQRNGGPAPSKDGAQPRERHSTNEIRRSTTTQSAPAKDSEEAVLTPEQQKERQTEYDTRLTYRIWELATTNANPAVDLLVCLERRQTIGFRYVDINREVVIHHGNKDTRVPVDNVRWLGKTMRRCEVRVLENEGHGLMASAIVMSNVLSEMAKEWEDWTTVVQGKHRHRRTTITHHSSRSGILAA